MSTQKIYREGKFQMGRCIVLVTKDAGAWHLSISCRKNSPSYKEIKEARYRFLPDNVVMAQIFPPQSEFVNVHPFCHHLWQINVNATNRENMEASETAAEKVHRGKQKGPVNPPKTGEVMVG